VAVAAVFVDGLVEALVDGVGGGGGGDAGPRLGRGGEDVAQARVGDGARAVRRRGAGGLRAIRRAGLLGCGVLGPHRSAVQVAFLLANFEKPVSRLTGSQGLSAGGFQAMGLDCMRRVHCAPPRLRGRGRAAVRGEARQGEAAQAGRAEA
jgi:hypothetical protein